MSILIRFFVRGGVWLTRLSPEPLRSALQRDGALVLQSACEGAWRQRGAAGLLRTGFVEWASLLVTAIRERMGRPLRITAGGAPQPPRGPHSGIGQTLLFDLRLAWRSLVASRTTVALAVITLALGIGVNSAVFSILDAVLWRPVPYASADRLATLWNVQTS